MASEIRVGTISSIDYVSGTVLVVYHDKDDSVTSALPLLDGEYRMPAVGDMVMVLHLSNGVEAGVVLGRYWSEAHKPPEGMEGLYRKDLDRAPGKAVIRYDGDTLTIHCGGDLILDAGGTIRIKGNGAVTVNGATIDLN